MKKMLTLFLAITLLCLLAVSAMAAIELTDVHCDEQAYTTKMPAYASTTFQEGNGLRIWLGEPGYVPNVLIWRRPTDLEDPETYVRDEYTEYMKKQYGSKLVGTSLFEYYDIAGKRLLGASYIYKGSSGASINQLHLYEVRDDGHVEYHARYLNSEREATLAALEAAIQYYQPDVESAAGGDTLIDVHCDEQSFSTKMPAHASTTFQENNGLRIWLDEPGYVPNVLIWRRHNDLDDPATYVRDEYTARMKEVYGERLVGITQHEYYDVGGKRLFASSYIYKGSSGSSINQIHLYEVRDDGHVEYDARFLNSERDMTLSALDAAVRYYQPDNAGAASGRPAVTLKGTTSGTSGTSRTNAGGKTLNVTKKQPIVSKTTTVKDSRYSMKLPANWKILTSGEFMTFCYKAWDPSNPNRTIFMFMKLEPYLKSQAAKNWYTSVANSGAELYRMFADAPVMSTCSLQGVLDAIPGCISFTEKYHASGLAISPNVFPDIRKAKILEKKPSSLPSPNTCKENVIARISYEDSLGQACEGMVTAQPIDAMQYFAGGVDTWPYTVYLFMGVTCPMGELDELQPILTECLGSFDFEQSYVRTAIGLSNEETRTLLQYGREMQAAHDSMVDAWYARQKSYDITSQKMSDAILGYDRLYDSETGEIYRAELGFYDSYDLHRQEYSNSNLQLIDSSSQNYYLEGVDYYITR